MSMPINYWAIIYSAIASIILGFIWYGPLFGKKWSSLSGIPMPRSKPSMDMMMKPMVISLIGAILMAYVLQFNLVLTESYLKIAGTNPGFIAAFWNWLGFVVPVSLNSVAWERKSWTLFFINSGYWLVLLGIMGFILSLWG